MDFSYLPDIFSLTIFILGFRPLVRRVGPHTDLWFLGWGFVLLHDFAMMFTGSAGVGHTIARLVSLLALDLCGLTFVLVSANVPVRRISVALIGEMGAAVVLQTSLYVLNASGRGHGVLNEVACLLFLAPAVHMMARKKERRRPVIVLSVAFGLFGVLMLPIAVRNPGLVADGSLSLLFLSAAYFYLISADRLTRGIVTAVAGLGLWGLSFPILALVTRFDPARHINGSLTELPQYMIVAGIILTLLEEHVQRTERMAMHDPLTDLPNRRLFEERLIATMEEAKEEGTTVACLVIDVDNFKWINDTLGHEAGDQLLRSLAVRLSWHMSPRDILARTGGDEFTALLAGVTDEHHLRFIAGAMMSAGSVPIVIDDKSVDLKISIGIALSPDHADDIDGLRRAADQAMYSAKRSGGSRLAFAGEE